MNKKGVHIVDLLKLNSMVKHDYANKDFDVLNVSKHLFGKRRIIESIAGGTGSNYGLLKITAYDNYPYNPDTAILNLSRSRITGLINCLQRSIITSVLSISSMMRHISIKMAV